MIPRQQKQLCVLVTAVLLLFLFHARHLTSAAVESSADAVSLSELQNMGENKEPFLLAATGFVSYGVLPDTSVRVHWWNNPEDGRYYLFLPSSANPQNLTLEFAGADSILIDGAAVQNGSDVSLPAGNHEISVPSLQLTYPLTVMQSSGLYSLYINTQSGSLDALKADKEHLESGYVRLADSNGIVSCRGELEYIKGHGNATWTETDKKAWQLKFLQKADPVSMGAARKWMLLPNSFDDTLLRNYLTLDIASEIGLAYTPQSVLVDCYINGEYQGNYQLAEKIEINEERIAIANLGKETRQLNEDLPPESYETYENGENGSAYSSKGYLIPDEALDLTGGYLLELEMLGRYQEEPAGFVTALGRSVVIKEPAFPSKEQVNYISTLYEEAETAVFSPDGYHAATGKHFSEYLDVESFAKKYIIEELSKNLDASRSSQYLYKPEDSVSPLLYAGPVWDYDNAWGYGGVVNDVELYNPESFYANMAIDGATLWHGLYQQPYFYENLCRIYQSEVLPVMDSILSEQLDDWSTALADSAMMNNYRWNQDVESTLEESRERYLDKVSYLKNFAVKRTAYLAQVWTSEAFQTTEDP